MQQYAQVNKTCKTHLLKTYTPLYQFPAIPITKKCTASVRLVKSLHKRTKKDPPRHSAQEGQISLKPFI